MAKDGRADIKEVRKSLLLPERKNKPLNETDPIDRVADELARFTMAVQTMSQGQADNIAKILRLVLVAAEKMATIDPVMISPPPVHVKINDSRPKRWRMENFTRDRDGKIEGVDVVAKEEDI